MTFKLSKRSLKRLEGVDEGLREVVFHAISITKIDFGVTCGLRTASQQKQLFDRKASQCDGVVKKSKHQSGNAVDLVAYLGSRISWELSFYDDLASAMRDAARACGVSIRWGAAWHVNDCRATDHMSMEEVMNEYIDLRRSEGRKCFIDGPHFERS